MMVDISKSVIKILNTILILVFFVGIGSIVYEYGFYPSNEELRLLQRIDLFVLWFFAFYHIIKLILHSFNTTYVKEHWFETLLTSLIIIQFIYLLLIYGFQELFTFHGTIISISKIWVIITQIGIFLAIISEGSSLNKKIAQLNLHPSQVLSLSFLFIILVGTGLLMLPRATSSGHSMPFIDALFTATSATCVTGLIVKDTGTYFSLFGQLVILSLIQIGGLGIMTFSSFFVLIFRRNISLREKSLVKEILNYDLLGVVTQVLKYSILLTFFLEFLGAIFLFLSWKNAFHSTSQAIYSSIFHAVSAFCNAGFSLNSNSLESFTSNYGVLLTVSSLIILGGLGFPVLINIFRLPLFERFKTKLKVYSLHTKLVLTVSLLLITIGTILILTTEWSNTLSGLSPGEKIINAFFQAVTPRTAGFNSIPISQVSLITLSILMLLMYIGASPGSTGGGIKTTTIGVLIASLKAIIRNKPSIEMYKREIPLDVFHRAIVVLLVSGIYIFLAFSLLLVFTPLPFEKLLFEEISAFATVGLSTGITPELNSIGKLIIIFSMYFGRVGVLTLILAIMKPIDKEQRYRYPSANVMVG